MYKRAALEKRLRLRDYGVFSFWGYDHAGKRYTASTDVRHGQQCSRDKCTGDSIKCPDWRAALAAAKRKEADRSVPSANPVAAKAKGFTLRQALNLIADLDKRVDAAPNTIQFHINHGRHLIQGFGPDRLCDSIDVAALTEYSDARLAEESQPERHSIQKDHRVLRHALRLAKKLGYYHGDPSALVVEGFDQAAGDRGFYTPGDRWLEEAAWIEALLAETSSNQDRHRIDRRDDILVYVNLGLRRREILLIKPEHIDFKARTVSITAPRRARRAERVARKTGLKTEGARRLLPLNDLMVELFKRRVRAVGPGEPLFKDWGSGNRDLVANWARARVRLLERARELAEAHGGKREGARAYAELDARLPTTLNFNDLRRTFCSQMKNAGVSKEDCAALLGDDVAMVDLVYGHTAIATLHRAVAKLPEMSLPPLELPRTKGPSRRQRQRLRKGAAAAETAKQSVSKTVSARSVSESNG